jgi:beta-galactosidase
VATEIKDPTRTWAYVFRSKETLARDKNRACVVAWSCGNESSYGINNQAEFDYAKANDATRLAYISQANLGQNAKTDFEDYHIYPTPTVEERPGVNGGRGQNQGQALKTLAASPNRAKCPVILTEYGAGDSKTLLDNWNYIWSTDAIVGGFIWEWQAQGMYDKFPERWSKPAPGARTNDPNTGYRASGGNGPVTADRKIQPLFYSLKEAHSPVHTSATEVAVAGGKCVVPVQNRYSFTDLGELTCHWQALAGEKALAGGESHIAAKPRSAVDASFPATAGMDTLKLEFIHPDGRSVYTVSLHIK